MNVNGASLVAKVDVKQTQGKPPKPVSPPFESLTPCVSESGSTKSCGHESDLKDSESIS